MSVVSHVHSMPHIIRFDNGISPEDHYILYGNGVPDNFILRSILDQWFVRVENTYNEMVAPGDRLLARSQRIFFQDCIMFVEHITTKVSYLTSYGNWIRHSIVTIEGEQSPYPYDIDPIHSEGESSPLLAQCEHGRYCLNCQYSTYSLSLLE